VAITNGAPRVADTVAAYTVAGTASVHVTGTMAWTNALTGGAGTFAAALNWQVASVALGMGYNPITVSGTNLLGTTASDAVTILRFGQDQGASPIHYVATNGTAIWPYTNWAQAAASIQDALDTATPGDTVLVSNGVYAAGGVAVYGTMTNRITLTKALTVRSVNGPARTFIVGQGTGSAGRTAAMAPCVAHT